MKNILATCSILVLAACMPQNQQFRHSTIVAQPAAIIVPVATTAPAGNYTLDKTHASLIFKVNHLGISNYPIRFTSFDANLFFNPTNPTSSSIVANIDPKSIETDFPNPTPNFDKELQGVNWLDVEKHPNIRFNSTKVELTGANTARVTGDLTLHGVTRQVALDTTFNGGYGHAPMDEKNARIGFSAKGKFKRSDFGMNYLIFLPAGGIGVGDEVSVEIEMEFIMPVVASK